MLNNPIKFIDPSGHIACSQLPGEDSTGCVTPTDELVRSLVDLTIELIDGNFAVDRKVLTENITYLLVASAEYNLSKDETAYVLSTAFGEVRFGAQTSVNGAYFDDLVENISDSNAIEDYFLDERRRSALGNLSEKDAVDFIGRDFAQVTGRVNYERMQRHFGYEYGVDMVTNPEVISNNPRLAAEITVYGMQNGSFTGYSFNNARGTNDFYYNSRRIINGVTNANSYKQNASQYESVLTVNHDA